MSEHPKAQMQVPLFFSNSALVQSFEDTFRIVMHYLPPFSVITWSFEFSSWWIQHYEITALSYCIQLFQTLAKRTVSDTVAVLVKKSCISVILKWYSQLFLKEKGYCRRPCLNTCDVLCNLKGLVVSILEGLFFVFRPQIESMNCRNANGCHHDQADTAVVLRSAFLSYSKLTQNTPPKKCFVREPSSTYLIGNCSNLVLTWCCCLKCICLCKSGTFVLKYVRKNHYTILRTRTQNKQNLRSKFVSRS